MPCVPCKKAPRESLGVSSMKEVAYYYAAYGHADQCVQYYGAAYEKAPAYQEVAEKGYEEDYE